MVSILTYYVVKVNVDFNKCNSVILTFSMKKAFFRDMYLYTTL